MKPKLNGAAIDHEATTGVEEAASTFWRMLAPTGRLLTCALYQTTDGLELRAGYIGEDPIWSEDVPSKDVGVVLAAAWKEAVVAKGGFVDVEPSR